MFLVGGPDGDFNVLTQGGEKFHEASDREIAGAVSHEQGDLWLLDAENFCDLDLSHAAAFENGVDLQGELGFEQLLLRIGKAKVREDVSAAFGYAGNAALTLFWFRFQFCLSR